MNGDEVRNIVERVLEAERPLKRAVSILTTVAGPAEVGDALRELERAQRALDRLVGDL